jgi:hypothetical protein
MQVESIRTGYGDLGQVGISYLCPWSSKNGVRGDRSLESAPQRRISSDVTEYFPSSRRISPRWRTKNNKNKREKWKQRTNSEWSGPS